MFASARGKSSGLQTWCKDCHRTYAHADYYADLNRSRALGREYAKRYHDRHGPEIKVRAKLWNQTNRDHLNAIQRARYHADINHSRALVRTNSKRYYVRHVVENKERNRAKGRRYYVAHRERINARIRRNQRKRYLTDPGFRLKCNVSRMIRGRLRQRLSGKGGKGTFKILPYSVDDLIYHLESNFKLGMSWENYGDWEIDHIVPDCRFDYHSPTDDVFQKCWALENLQPLWAADNLSKGGRV